jgi:large subunit ribosomal protein L22
MTGPKTNEGARVAGERTGTKAQSRYVRASAYKAREVLDLIRGKSVAEAAGILRFTERGIAEIVGKTLASAVANAQNNDSQDPEELKVVACFADEGPTLRRFRPRARGRATRIRKRTCHITIVVGRMSEAELEQMRRKQEAQAPGRRGRGGAAVSRRERVARSRQQSAAARGRGGAPAAEETPDEDAEDLVDEDTELEDAEDLVDEDADLEDTDLEEDAVDEEADESDEGGEGSASDEPQPRAGKAKRSPVEAISTAESSEPEASETMDTEKDS